MYGLYIHLYVLVIYAYFAASSGKRNGMALWNFLSLPSSMREVCNGNTGYRHQHSNVCWKSCEVNPDTCDRIYKQT